MATPGRLLDLHSEGACELSGVSYLVLNEADRMLDMGFEKDVRAIINLTNPVRTSSRVISASQAMLCEWHFKASHHLLTSYAHALTTHAHTHTLCVCVTRTRLSVW